MRLEPLLDADGRSGHDAQTWTDFVEHVAETLDIGPGTRVWDVDCGAGSFLLPLDLNRYVIGGHGASSDKVARAREAMPHGRFVVGAIPVVDVPGEWDVVLASHGLGACRDVDEVRALLARMVTKAAHAVAILGVDEARAPFVDRIRMMRLLGETGMSAVQFEGAADGLWHVFARVGARR